MKSVARVHEWKKEERHEEAGEFSAQTFASCELYFSRLMLGGLEWGDLVNALHGLHKPKTLEDWDDWFARWFSLGQDYEERASRAGAAGHSITQRAWLRKAAAAFHAAEFMFFDNPEAKFDARRRVTRVFESMIPLLDIEVRPMQFPFRQNSLPAYFLRRRDTAEPSPCVILVNGLDSAKEVELYAFALELLARGNSVMVFDGPGQGVLAGLYPMVLEFEQVFESVLRGVLQLQEVDPDRIGVCGVSFGGYLAPRVAALFPREIKACASLSGGFDHDNYPKINPLVRQDFRFVFGQPKDEMMAKLAVEQLNLRSIPRLKAPLLCVHAEEDSIIAYESCIRLLEWAQGDRDLLVYPGSRHVCTNYFGDFIPRFSDWMTEKLAISIH